MRWGVAAVTHSALQDQQSDGRAEGDQDAVWDCVADQITACAAPSPTQALSDAVEMLPFPFLTPVHTKGLSLFEDQLSRPLLHVRRITEFP